jgi:hypothetical protein
VYWTLSGYTTGAKANDCATFPDRRCSLYNSLADSFDANLSISFSETSYSGKIYESYQVDGLGLEEDVGDQGWGDRTLVARHCVYHLNNVSLRFHV